MSRERRRDLERSHALDGRGKVWLLAHVVDGGFGGGGPRFPQARSRLGRSNARRQAALEQGVSHLDRAFHGRAQRLCQRPTSRSRPRQRATTRHNSEGSVRAYQGWPPPRQTRGRRAGRAAPRWRSGAHASGTTTGRGGPPACTGRLPQRAVCHIMDARHASTSVGGGSPPASTCAQAQALGPQRTRTAAEKPAAHAM